jgi:8-oxo-dGTP pyrophosphatase MutT (NUDIX family)
MAFVGSYLWRLRQKVGSELILMPGAMIVLQRDDGRILLTERGDTGAWCLPAGAAEIGGSFVRTAVDELAEETSVRVSASSLVPFGCLSEPDTHTIRYPNGDVTHCFAMCFLARDWQGDPQPDQAESTAVRFVAPNDLPEPMHEPSVHVGTVSGISRKRNLPSRVALAKHRGQFSEGL